MVYQYHKLYLKLLKKMVSIFANYAKHQLNIKTMSFLAENFARVRKSSQNILVQPVVKNSCTFLNSPCILRFIHKKVVSVTGVSKLLKVRIIFKTILITVGVPLTMIERNNETISLIERNNETVYSVIELFPSFIERPTLDCYRLLYT